MNIYYVQVLIFLFMAISFCCYLSVTALMLKKIKVSRSISIGFKDLIKAAHLKSNVSIFQIIRLTLLFVLANIIFLELIKPLLSYEGMEKSSIFIFYLIFVCLGGITKLEKISLFDKIIILISNTIFILLLTSQYFVYQKMLSVEAINITFSILFLIQFIVIYILNGEIKYGNIFDKKIDFLTKILFVFFVIKLFDYTFFTGIYQTLFYLGALVVGSMLFFSSIEKYTNNLNTRQIFTISKKLNITILVILSLGSAIIGYFI